MKRRPRTIDFLFAGMAVAMGVFFALSENGAFNTEIWKREDPLVNPIAITSVRDGAITLADGRTIRPAGVRRRTSVAAEDYDHALRLVGAQGVVVIRDLGDGTAFLLAEPKFYNWDGTRNYEGSPWKRWAGSYLRCPVSEFLILSAYASPAPEQAGLTEHERWRLEGVDHLGGIGESPRRISDALAAFRYDGSESYLSDYDTNLELIWKAPPPP